MPKTNEHLRKYNCLSSEINSLYHKAAVMAGISDSVQLTLYIVYENDGKCLQSEIYKQSGISRQTINSAIRKLEKEQIVYMEHGSGRNTIVCLTEKGKQFAVEKIEPLYQIENQIFNEWAEDEVRQYLQLTEQFKNSLKEKLEHIGGLYENSTV